jgi:hypothetical protein
VIGLARTDPGEELWNQFHQLVNMSSPDLRNWLGAAPDDPDRYLYDPDVDVRDLGPRVLNVLEKRRVDLTGDDEAVMRTVLDVVPAWLADPRRDPGGDAGGDQDADDGGNERWRHSLMSLGHDPLKPDSPRGEDALALRSPGTDA